MYNIKIQYHTGAPELFRQAESLAEAEKIAIYCLGGLWAGDPQAKISIINADGEEVLYFKYDYGNRRLRRIECKCKGGKNELFFMQKDN